MNKSLKVQLQIPQVLNDSSISVKTQKKKWRRRGSNLNRRGIIRLNMTPEQVIHTMATIERARRRGLTAKRRERANAHNQTRDIKQRKKHHMSKTKPEIEPTDKQFPERLIIMGFRP